jgi:hypothetical protein
VSIIGRGIVIIGVYSVTYVLCQVLWSLSIYRLDKSPVYTDDWLVYEFIFAFVLYPMAWFAGLCVYNKLALKNVFVVRNVFVVSVSILVSIALHSFVVSTVRVFWPGVL